MSNDSVWSDDFDRIIKRIHELFRDCRNDPNKLSQLVDKYLIPTILERNENGEIITPSFLRNEMLDTLPSIFWETPKKVFEPCCGKYGFTIDIVNRFMN